MSDNTANLLSFEPKSLKFLNSNKIVTSGNGPRGKVQVLGSSDNSDSIMHNESFSFQNINEIKFPTRLLDDLEICGISAQERTCVAVINRDMKSSQSYIGILDIDLLYDNCPMKLSSTLYSHSCVDSNFTSLSFYKHQTKLAASTEIGDICIFDLLCDIEVNSFCADSCGINKVIYNRSGQIITIGNSSESQLRLWDARQSNLGVVTNIVNSFSHPRNNKFSTVYSYVQIHNSLPIVYCGSKDGQIVEWDLRYESTAPSSIITTHNDEITSILCHPYEDNIIISSSIDGTIQINNVHHSSGLNETIVSESSSITSMDLNVNGLLIASTSLGTLVARKL